MDDAIFTTEYAWTGWFSTWQQKDWHLMVRLSNLQASLNLQFLGDRDLSTWVGENTLHFSTYRYTDQKDQGLLIFGSRYHILMIQEMDFMTASLDVNHYLPNKFSHQVQKFNAKSGSFLKDCFKKELIKLSPKVDFNDRETKLFNSPQDGKDRLLSKNGLNQIKKQQFNMVMVIGLDKQHNFHLYQQQVDKMIGHSSQQLQIKKSLVICGSLNSNNNLRNLII
ncbi:hypothetical protein pb186bvf_019096 [Paramecium bursaria]